MANTPPPESSMLDSSDSGLRFDSSVPFRGVVVCCTSIAPDLRTEIAQHCTELGGRHIYDLTPDVTHLVVGEHATPKYRHVAKERPDVMCVAPGWVEAVRDVWVEDREIDFEALEAAWRLRALETGGLADGVLGAVVKAEEGGGGDGTGGGRDGRGEEREERDPDAGRTRLVLCLTGFEDQDERQEIVDQILKNGGAYTGDLTRKVTHLVAFRPEGKKYEAAKSWGTNVVAIEWLRDSIERGMILDETLYDPLLPVEKRGKGAWTVRLKPDMVAGAKRTSLLGKRAHDSAAVQERRSKMRRTTSSKLSSQMGSIWGGIAAKDGSSSGGGGGGGGAQSSKGENASDELLRQHQPGGTEPLSGAGVNLSLASGKEMEASAAVTVASRKDMPVFSSCLFFIHGFSAAQHDIVANAVQALGGSVCGTMDEVSSDVYDPPPDYRFLLVPQTSQPDTHPLLPENVRIVTEFYLERCLYKRSFIDPNDHVLGRPFPQFPIEGFAGLAICTSGFTDIDLNQVDKTVRQLGARYNENFTQKADLLVCTSLAAVRKAKLDLALGWGTPIVSQEWLWQCCETGFKVPVRDHLFKQLGQRVRVEPGEGKRASTGHDESQSQGPERIDPAPFQHAEAREPVRKPVKNKIRDVDAGAFEQEGPLPPLRAKPRERKLEVRKDDFAVTHFERTERAEMHDEQQKEQDKEGQGNNDTRNEGSLHSAPLSERSVNSLNRGSQSPQKQPQRESATDKETKKAERRERALTRVESEVADSEAAGDDPIPMPSVDQSEDPAAAPHAAEADAAAAVTVRRRKPAEGKEREALAAAAAAESAAVKERIASMISHAAAPGEGEGEGEGEDDVAGGREGEGGLRSKPAAPTTTARRRRGISGRAVSNVSAASSVGSVDSAGAGGGANRSASIHSERLLGKQRHSSGGGGASANGSVASAFSGPAGLFGSLAGSGLQDGGGGGEGEGGDGDGDKAPPPPTQLGFLDPAAKESRKRLLDKMMTRSKASGARRTVSEGAKGVDGGGRGAGRGSGSASGTGLGVAGDTPGRRTRSRA